MTCRQAAPALCAGWLVACTLVNPPEPRAPERRECDGGACQDACARCAAEATCEPGDGGVECRCPRGLVDGRGDGSRCEPAEDCTADADCGALGRCVASDAGAACACAEGYERQGGRCRNLDECARGSHDCGDGAVCVDRQGSFVCECRDGYTETGDGRSCENVDECARGETCGAHAQCTDTAGSYVCRCEEGYAGDPYRGCHDTDECARGVLRCEAPALCRDRAGPDRCMCPRYLRDVHGDGQECVDERLRGAVAFDSTTLRLAATAPFVLPLEPAEERVQVFADGPALFSCDKTYLGFGYAESFVAVVSRFDLDAQLACKAQQAYDRTIHAQPPPGLVGDARGGYASLSVGLREDANEGGRRCELQHLTQDDGWLLDLMCPATPIPQRMKAALRPGGEGIYLLLHHDRAGEVGALAVPEPTGQGAVLARLSRGEAQWVTALTPAEAAARVSVEAFAVDAAGNSYLYGRSDSDAQLGAAGALSGPASFMLSLDRAGALRWLRTSHDAGGLPQVRALAAGASGELLALIAARSRQDAIAELVRLDASDGAELGRREIGRGPRLAPERLALDAAGNAVVTGVLSGMTRLGDEWYPDAASAGAARPFVAAYDAEGAFLFGRLIEAADALIDLAVQPSGTIYLAGRFTPPAELGGGVRLETGSHFVLRLEP